MTGKGPFIWLIFSLRSVRQGLPSSVPTLPYPLASRSAGVIFALAAWPFSEISSPFSGRLRRLIYNIATGTSLTSHAGSDWWIFLAFAIIPTLGHTVLNWSLKCVGASIVSISILGEGYTCLSVQKQIARQHICFYKMERGHPDEQPH